MTNDLISRQALCEYALNQKDKSVTPNDIMRFPSAEPYTDQEILTMQELEQAQIQRAFELGREDAEPKWIPVTEILRDLPPAQPEQRWIPCSEGLPEADERVLVTTGSYDYYVWDCMSNRSDNYFWEDESGFYHDKHEVIAWMPLPEPYEEDK